MAQAQIELLVELVGQDKVSSVLKESQEQMRKLGTETQKAAKKSGAFAKVTANLKNVNTQWTEMRSKISLVASALQAPLAVYDEIIGRLKSGEIAGNADIIFRQMHEHAQETMDAANRVTMGIMTETDIQQLANQMELLGATSEQQVGVLEVATKMYLATGKDMSATAERLVTAVISGRTSSLKMLGVTIDLDLATKDYAISQGKTVEELSKADKIYARLGATVHHLNSKFDQVDFEPLMMDAHKLDNNFKNLISDMESIAAGADLASAANRRLKLSMKGVNEEAVRTVLNLRDLPMLERLEKGKRAALNAIREIGQKSIHESKDLMETMMRMLEFNKSEHSAMYEEFQSGASRDGKVMEEIVENTFRRLRKIYEQRIIDRKKEQDRLDEMTELSAAFWEAQMKFEIDAEKKAEAARKAARARRIAAEKQHAKDVAKIDKEWLIYKASQISEEAVIEAKKNEEIKEHKAKFKIEEKQYNQGLIMIAAKFQADMDKIKDDDPEDPAKQQRKIASLRMQLRGEFLAFESDSIQEAHSMRARALELQQQLDAEEITAEEHKFLTLIDIKQRENDARRRLEEEKRDMQQASLSAAAAYSSELISFSRTNKDDWAAGLGTMSAMTTQVAKDWKGLKAGAPSAVSALGNVAAAGIRDERAAAGVKAAFAAASSVFAFAKGNIPSGVAFALSATMFAAIAGKSDSGKGGKAAKSIAPNIASGGGGMAGQTGGGGEFTVNVMGFVGSTAQLGADVSQAVDEVSSSGLPAAATI